MSAAYFIVLDRQDPGFDPFVNGKSLAKEARRINKLARKLGLRRLDDFVAQDSGDLADLLGAVPQGEGAWFGAEEGIDWARAVQEQIRGDLKVVKDSEGVLADLGECVDVLERARAVGARWHFEIDY